MTGEIPTVAVLPLNDRGTAGWDDKEWGLRNARNDGRVGTAEAGRFQVKKFSHYFHIAIKIFAFLNFV